MKKTLIIIFIVLFSGIAVTFAMSKNSGNRKYSWRYKMTVEIETPEGIKTGSAVREVNILFTPNSSSPRGYDDHLSMKGEAVVIDLGKRGVVFAILSGPQLGVDYGKNIIFSAFPEGAPGRTIKGAEYYSELTGKRILEPTHYPVFVAFKDINDPKSVVPLVKYKSNDQYPKEYTIEDEYFEKYFGEGVRLKTVMIETTNEEIENWKVERYLSWIREYYNKRFDGNRFGTIEAENKTANGLSSGAFTVGKGK